VSYQPTPAGPERRISPAGVIVVVVGIALVAVALFALDWISANFAGTDFTVKFKDLHDQAAGFDGIDKVYFSWLAYAVAGATVLFAVLATIPQAAQMASKALTGALGAFGIIISFVVFSRGNVDVGDRGIGFWLFVIGLAVLIVGAMIPSRPVVTYLPDYGMPTQQDRFAAPYGAVPPAQPYQPPSYAAPSSMAPPSAPMTPAYGQPPTAAWEPAAAPSTTPAGWQPDPTGRNQYRYWDGQTWTEHVSNGPVQASDPI